MVLTSTESFGETHTKMWFFCSFCMFLGKYWIRNDMWNVAIICAPTWSNSHEMSPHIKIYLYNGFHPPIHLKNAYMMPTPHEDYLLGGHVKNPSLMTTTHKESLYNGTPHKECSYKGHPHMKNTYWVAFIYEKSLYSGHSTPKNIYLMAPTCICLCIHTDKGR